MNEEKKKVYFDVWNMETDEIETLEMDEENFKAMEEEEAKIAKRRKEFRDYDDEIDRQAWQYVRDDD